MGPSRTDKSFGDISEVHSDSPAVPSDGQASREGSPLRTRSGSGQKKDRQKKKALAAASAWLKNHEELGSQVVGSLTGGVEGSVTPRLGTVPVAAIPAPVPGAQNSVRDRFEGVRQGPGMSAEAEPMPVLENPESIRKVEAQLVRQNGEVTGMEQYSDKEHLSKLYVANGGGQSELEKQEHARLQKTMDLIFCWSDISVSITDHAAKRMQNAINNISGYVAAGQILAICGCSGAGKSALLQTLAGTLSNDQANVQVSGELSVSGSTIQGRLINRPAVTYVPQERVFLPNLTVRQTLRSEAAMCHSAATMSPALLDRRCNDLLAFLKLEACADKKIGGGFLPQGISRAEHRRLCLASAIIDNPSIILMDAFDDGLPAADSDKLIGPLLGLASHGAAVVLSSAQPSSKLWGSASTVCLMSQGRAKFFGPKEEAVPYFNGICGSSCPLRCNPAEYFIGLMDPTNDAPDSVAARASQWSMSLDSIMPAPEAGAGANNPKLRENSSSSAARFGPLCKKALRHNLATARCVLGRFLVVLLASFVAGAMYEGVGKNKKAMDEGSISGRASAFFLLQCVVFLALPLLPALQTEHQILAHDVCVRQLKRAPCVAALWVARLPFSLLLALVASLLVTLWTSIGFASFHFVLLGTWLSILAAEGLVASIAAMNLDLLLSSTAASLLLSFFLFCQGYLRPAQDIPPWLIWGHYISFPTYAFRAMMVSEFTQDFDPNNEVLEQFGMEDEDAATSLGVLVGFAAFFQVAWVLLLLGGKQLNPKA